MKACFLNFMEGKLHSYLSCICLRDALAFTTVNSSGEVLKSTSCGENERTILFKLKLKHLLYYMCLSNGHSLA